MDKPIFKFNNGNLALLCSKCNVIIKEGYEFTTEERSCYEGTLLLPAQYCEKCKATNTK